MADYYPASWNAHDSLAEALALSGDLGDALDSYTCIGSSPSSCLIPGDFDNSQGNVDMVVDISLDNLPEGCQSAMLSYGLRDTDRLDGSSAVPILIGD